MSDNDIDQEEVANEKLVRKIRDEVLEKIETDFSSKLRWLERKERLSGWGLLLALFLGSLGGSFLLLLTFPTASAIKNSNRWDGEDRQLYINCMSKAANDALPVGKDPHEWCVRFVNMGFSED